MVNAYEICSASQRTIAVAFGAEDFTNDMGVERTDDDSEVSYPRSVVAVAARAAGIQALDTPYVKFKDGNGLKDDASNARKFGYKGKFAIHPSQIQDINKCFSPSDSEIEHAKAITSKLFPLFWVLNRHSITINHFLSDSVYGFSQNSERQ